MASVYTGNSIWCSKWTAIRQNLDWTGPDQTGNQTKVNKNVNYLRAHHARSEVGII